MTPVQPSIVYTTDAATGATDREHRRETPVSASPQDRPAPSAPSPLRGLALGLFYVTVVTLADLLTGEAIFLPSLLALAPLFAAVQASPKVTTILAAVVVPTALLLGIPDRDIATAQHAVDTGLVLAVSMLSVCTTVLRARTSAALHHAELLATRDCLSGTLNRRALIDRAEHLVAIRAESRPDLTVLMIDIDHFKAINDTYGHWVGDEVIVEIARRIETVLRDEDLLGRYGGDEFIAVLVGGRRRGIHRVAERIRDEVFIEPITSSAGPIDVAVSVGGAAIIDDAETLANVIRRADEALMQSKVAGRNQANTL